MPGQGGPGRQADAMQYNYGILELQAYLCSLQHPYKSRYARMVFTTSNVFIETLVKAGITHAFVNLGSDHPGRDDLHPSEFIGNVTKSLCL